MKKILNLSVILLAVGLMVSLTGCPPDGGEGDDDADNIKWTNDANATLTVSNNTSKDMVIFQGQTPTPSNIIGGVRGLSTREFNISDYVDDFNLGGYMILRGVSLDEYNRNKANLSQARIEYSAMATYGQGKKFRTEISPNYMGDYAYRVTNLGRIGIELRKDSPEGEKIGYLPSLASNSLFYADTTSGFAIYPVYVYFSRSTAQVTTLRPTSHFDTVTVSPRPATGSEIQVYTFPNDPNVTWESIRGTLSSPVAYVTVSNNVPNQSGRVTISGTNRLHSQNNYDTIGAGEILTYEITSTNEGAQRDLVLQFYNGALNLPVRIDGAMPVLKNGFDYQVSVTGSGSTADGYTVTITESSEARDLSDDIMSL